MSGLSLAAVSGGYSSVVVRRLLVCGGFSCRAPALGLWASVLLVGLRCPEACGISVLGPGIKSMSPCIGRRIPNHWTTQEVPRNGVFTRNHWFVFTRNTTSPHVTFTQKSQEQEKCIPFTETTIYLSNIDDFRKFIF